MKTLPDATKLRHVSLIQAIELCKAHGLAEDEAVNHMVVITTIKEEDLKRIAATVYRPYSKSNKGV